MLCASLVQVVFHWRAASSAHAVGSCSQQTGWTPTKVFSVLCRNFAFPRIPFTPQKWYSCNLPIFKFYTAVPMPHQKFVPRLSKKIVKNYPSDNSFNRRIRHLQELFYILRKIQHFHPHLNHVTSNNVCAVMSQLAHYGETAERVCYCRKLGLVSPESLAQTVPRIGGENLSARRRYRHLSALLMAVRSAM